MRILIVSDTHGRIEEVLQYINKAGNIDKIIHLGDHSRDGYDIKFATGIDTEIVKGNCDWMDINTPDEKLIKMNGLRIFISHGHYLNVRQNRNKLAERARELSASIALYGHNHYPLLEEIRGIKIFNPGSPTEARNGAKRSIGLIEIKEDDIDIEIISLNETGD